MSPPPDKSPPLQTYCLYICCVYCPLKQFLILCDVLVTTNVSDFPSSLSVQWSVGCQFFFMGIYYWFNIHSKIGMMGSSFCWFQTVVFWRSKCVYCYKFEWNLQNLLKANQSKWKIERLLKVSSPKIPVLQFYFGGFSSQQWTESRNSILWFVKHKHSNRNEVYLKPNTKIL